MQVDLHSIVNPIRINDKAIDFSKTAEHVGILRSTEGNGPTILARIASHKKALAAILHVDVEWKRAFLLTAMLDCVCRR